MDSRTINSGSTVKDVAEYLDVRVPEVISKLMALGDSWRDQEHDRFRQEFEATMLVLERFLEVSDEHIPSLLRKAERIEEYLSQR